jgi:peptidoglycan hydrolase-like protein with peptidoglycan-binding domain
MRAKKEVPFAFNMPSNSIGLGTDGSAAAAAARLNGASKVVAPLSPASEIDSKYALLLKYSDKARVAEQRLDTLPDDLLKRFRIEAVEDPSRIEDIVTILLAEARKRLSPFDDPDLNNLYQKLGPYGPEAQSEFRRVLELLQGQVDVGQVFAQIIDDHLTKQAQERSQRSGNQGWASAPSGESARDFEERRRRAAKIAHEIDELRRACESRSGTWSSDKPRKVERLPVQARVENSDDPAAVARSTKEANDNSHPMRLQAGPAVTSAPTLADTPMVPPRRYLPEASSTWGSRRTWSLSLLTAAVVITALSGGAATLMAPPISTDDETHRPAVAKTQQPSALNDAIAREAAERAAAIAAAALREAEANTRAEEAERKAVEAEAEASRQAAVARQAVEREQRAATESARQIAEAERRASAQVAVQREAEEARHQGEAPTPKATESRRDFEKAEAGMNLSDQDRKRVQAALTTLGHEVQTTGFFGPITRAAITAWQKTQGLPATGFLDDAQLASLSAQAAASKRPDEQTKLDPQRVEAGLNLSDRDRKQVQAALTALGHEVPPTGYFGPVTRAAITAWQKKQGLLATGYLTATQCGTLQQQAAATSAN